MTSAVASIYGGYYVKPTLMKQTGHNNLHNASHTDTQRPYNELQKLRELWKTSEIKDYFKEAGKITPKGQPAEHKERIISAQASHATKDIMRLVCADGTGRKADVAGYPVIGKTGTAEKHRSDRKGYDQSSLISSFVGAFPYHDPEYVVYVMVYETKTNLKISHDATGGVVAAPAV